MKNEEYITVNSISGRMKNQTGRRIEKPITVKGKWFGKIMMEN